MTSANPQDQARHRIASGVEKIRQASQRGATREEIEALFAEMERPQTFNTAIGNLLVKTKDALLLSSRDQDLSHLNLQQAQQHCDDFFKGQPYVRYWVVAQAFQQLGLGIVKAMQLLPAIGELDGDKRWMWVAIASEVAHRAGERFVGGRTSDCTRDQFWQEWDRFTDDDNALKQFSETLTEQDRLFYSGLTAEH